MENMRKTKLLPRKRRMKEKKLADSFYSLGFAEEETFIHAWKRRNLIRSMIVDAKRILGL